MADSLEEAVSGADLVVLAMPVDQIPAACARLARAVPAEAIVTDVGSAKAEVVEAGEAAFGPRFVGGHPMAGSERHGIDAADGRLFEDAWWVITPTADNVFDRVPTGRGACLQPRGQDRGGGPRDPRCPRCPTEPCPTDSSQCSRRHGGDGGRQGGTARPGRGGIP